MPYCDECGSKTTPNQKFCETCGNRLSELPTSQTETYEKAAKSLPHYSERDRVKEEHKPSSYQQYYESIPQRSYFNYFGLSLGLAAIGILIFIVGAFFAFTRDNFATLGLFLIFTFISLLGAVAVQYYYIYSNFNDFRKLHYKTHDRNDPPLNPHDPIIMLILMFVFSPIAFFFKYQQLRDHLERGHGHTKNLPPSGLKYLVVQFGPLGLFILSIILSLLGGRFTFLIIIAVLASLLSFILILYFEYTWQERFNEHVRAHGA